VDGAHFDCGLAGEDYEDGIAVLDAIQATEPGDGVAGRLDGELVAGLGLAVGALKVLPLKVIRGGYDASLILPGIAESRLLTGSLHAGIKESTLILTGQIAPLHRVYGLNALLIRSKDGDDVGRAYLAVCNYRAPVGLYKARGQYGAVDFFNYFLKLGKVFLEGISGTHGCLLGIIVKGIGIVIVKIGNCLLRLRKLFVKALKGIERIKYLGPLGTVHGRVFKGKGVVLVMLGLAFLVDLAVFERGRKRSGTWYIIHNHSSGE
jgi:hypothetical protein